MGTVSHRQRGRDDTQISNSRETKSDDLDISLRRNASRLFSQLKNRVRQTGGERKNKNRIIRRGNRHFEFPVICQIYPQLHLLTGFCVCCGWEELRCDSLYCFAVRPDERQTTNLGHLFKKCSHTCVNTVCVCLLEGCGEGWRKGADATGSLSQP